jgi:enoyl-CoA hydratase/carnithine racemase
VSDAVVPASQGDILVEVEEHAATGRIAKVTIAHERKLNTLNPPLMQCLIAALQELGADPELRMVVLTGAGAKAFVGGADINAMAALPDPDAAEAFIRLVHGCCRAVREMPMPVIARINGWTLGAGLELAASCDLRLAADTAQFGMPEVRVGLPSVVEAALLPGLIGWGRTRRLLLLGETIDAETALEWGLVEQVVPEAELDAALGDWLGMLGEAGANAIRLQKRLIRQWEDLPVTHAVESGVAAFRAAYHTDEPAQMLGAFARRRRGT